MVDVVRIPKLGLSDAGELVSWEVDVGAPVSAGQVVAVLESEKASAEIESPSEGVLLTTYVEEGDEVAIEVGRPLAVVGADGEAVPSLEDLEREGASAESTASDAVKSAVTPVSDDEPPDTERADVKTTPRAQRRLQEVDVDLTTIEGTGPQGAITEDDIEAYLETREAETRGQAPATTGDLTVTESRELSGIRKTIADRLSRSAREKPHVMGTREVSIERLERVRARLDEEYDVALSLNDLLLHFVGRVLEDLPAFNAHFEDDTHELIDEVNVGYAVDGPRGLVVPVIREVPRRSLPELSEARRSVVQRVLDDDFDPADLRGGTFTVTNVGVFDMDVSYSIINPPEVAILAIGRRKYAPVERDGEVDFESVITFSLTIDHRVLDGADSGAFLDRLAEYVESPGAALDAR
ncbi:dihydrolipoamide acetyltransferase family protein [Halomarina ordinaria]|uniref:Dihydrolipoamide acetyltransferase family protein n=1 Tax=Halomarina ordinaria TaxID=3033939 RepID=A0ABD5UF25_9EURY|nr:dihydrolipoamide acetyltransferase family protein [Halomarina sp. PSRA2]